MITFVDCGIYEVIWENWFHWQCLKTFNVLTKYKCTISEIFRMMPLLSFCIFYVSIEKRMLATEIIHMYIIKIICDHFLWHNRMLSHCFIMFQRRYQKPFFKVSNFLKSFRVLINKLSQIVQNTSLQTPRTKQFVEITT